jgi:predicted DsbA family dithiol-disulfide isomerase
MKIDVWSDIVCPWCYIGRARLQHALADFPHQQQVEVVYRSYQLDPSFPSEPIPVLEMFTQKYGASPEQATAAEGRVAALARIEGLPYTTDRMHGNTATAHRLLQFAGVQDRRDPLLESLFRTHFSGKASIFDPDVLLELAVKSGLDRAESADVIESDRYRQEVEQDVDAARQLGIGGVPFFLINGQLGVSGAQPTETLLAALGTAWKEHS